MCRLILGAAHTDTEMIDELGALPMPDERLSYASSDRLPAFEPDAVEVPFVEECATKIALVRGVSRAWSAM